jgi:hypothetical protein
MNVENLDEYFFPPLHELNTSPPDQCIHFTKKGKRCPWPLEGKDKEKVQSLRDEIVVASKGTVGLKLLEEYAKYNCCRRKTGCGHRNILEDKGLLEPLTIRWQTEARQRRSTEGFEPTTDSQKLADLVDLPSTTRDTRLQYNLRPRTTAVSADSTATRTKPVSKKPRSEFRPHIEDPDPDDTVSFKVLSPLKDRDFEHGKLYVFKRESSPGYVKIGWTARSIQRRLDDWASCGYTPELLFSAYNVPNAQRAETLTHYELWKEWRVERMCKAFSCQKSHREWFEIDEERAKQVLGDWVDFFKSARPYDSCGILKPEWVHAVKAMSKEGELVTAKRLLEMTRRTPAKALLPQVTEHSLVEVSAPLIKPLEEKPALPTGLSTTAKEDAKHDRQITKCQPANLKEMVIANPGLLSTQPITQDSALTGRLRNLSKLTSESFTNETLSEQPNSTTQPPSSTAKLLTVNPNCASKLLPSRTVLLYTAPSGKVLKSDFKSLSPREIPSKSVTAVDPRCILTARPPSPKNPSVNKSDLESVTAPSCEKLSPELIPLPPSPPPSP